MSMWFENTGEAYYVTKWWKLITKANAPNHQMKSHEFLVPLRIDNSGKATGNEWRAFLFHALFNILHGTLAALGFCFACFDAAKHLKRHV